MAKKDDESNSKQKKERRFSQEQYNMLKRCSDKKDMTEWNEWRKKNPKEDIVLEGANFSRRNLEGTHLNSGKVGYPHPDTGTTIPNKPGILPYRLEGEVHLEKCKFVDARASWADFRGALLEDADFNSAHLENAHFQGACLEGTNFFRAHVEGVRFEVANVDGSTLIWECSVDRKTDFRGVGLDSCRIDAGTKQLLKYNIRRRNWEDWYERGPWCIRFLKKLFIQPFWWMSDYGRSTGHVAGVFFLLAFLFAAVYMNCGYWRPPGIVRNLVVQPEIGEAAWHYFLRAPVRAVYFSIVTMTTLGFGDMYANKGSIAGHVILAVQVILGYVLLGALITRFAVLFTAGGPAGRFAESRKRPD